MTSQLTWAAGESKAKSSVVKVDRIIEYCDAERASFEGTLVIELIDALRKSVRRAVSRGKGERDARDGGDGDDDARASGREDALASFRGVSLASLQALHERVRAEEEAPGVQLGECMRASRKRGLKRGQSVEVLRKEDDFLVCRSPFWGEPTARNKRANGDADDIDTFEASHKDDVELETGREVRIKTREEWTLEDICQFVVLPAMRVHRGGIYAKEVLEDGQAKLGDVFEGAYVSAPRATKLSALIDALEAHYAGVDAATCFVWIDVLCANQVRAKPQDVATRATGADADMQAEDAQDPDQAREMEEVAVTRELLRRSRIAAGSFDERLLFFKSWMDPVPLSRSWCVYEVLAGMELEAPFHLLCPVGEDARFATALQHTPQKIIKLCETKFDVTLSRCRNRHDRRVIDDVLAEIYGSEKHANDAFNACVRAWLAESTLRAVEAKRASIEPGDAIAWFGALLHRAGQLVSAAGNYSGARSFYQEALDVSRRELGNRNARVARLLCDIAICQRRLGFLDEALESAKEARPLFEAKFGHKHLETAALLRTTAEIAMEQQQRQLQLSSVEDKEEARRSLEAAYKDASGYYDEAIEIYRQLYGDDHKLVAMALNNAAHVHLQNQKYERAIKYCKEALSIRKRELGDSHPKLASTYSNIGEIYRVQGLKNKALEQYDRALEIYFAQAYEDHPRAKNTLDDVLQALCGHEGLSSARQALKGFEEATGSVPRVVQDLNPQILPTLEQKATVLLDDKSPDRERGLFHLSVALGIARQIYGERTEPVADILDRMASVFSDLKDLDQSVKLSELAYDIRKQALGPMHPSTRRSESIFHSYERRKSLLDTEPPVCV
ncbi:Kinesin light chain [Hondaea fermentalgiana]|uniref:Kinesin light chain n=1 Tax=Hondaea fermentalgiana TaxID=2315210 RepID=A0A2R5GLN1_9STRA|nr:Kinesin light chain [Hondaea fermentalgiana]|eukprot:GBG29533.1 Kinesin light chain [Hondaea fermentalgiana]